MVSTTSVKCLHGYYEDRSPDNLCPWCHGWTSGNADAIPMALGSKGNGWLLRSTSPHDIPCRGCGGPACAGWGAWVGPDPITPETLRAAVLEHPVCYGCNRDGIV